jgi:predicted O-methyltransferase YrrM
MKMHTSSLVRLFRNKFQDRLKIEGCEVGVWRGTNAAVLLEEFPQLFLYMVDHYEARKSLSIDAPQEVFNDAWKSALDLTNFADGRRQLLLMESFVAATKVMEESLDFVFIDASHDYQSTSRDIELWAPKVKPGGILCGHDYNGRGDRVGVFGVKRAVDEFCERTERAVMVKPGLIWVTVI